MKGHKIKIPDAGIYVLPFLTDPVVKIPADKPFLVIDMVIASLLISMGMLMLPPVLISLPFKILLFVMVDGWQLVTSTAMTSIVQPEQIISAAMSGVP